MKLAVVILSVLVLMWLSWQQPVTPAISAINHYQCETQNSIIPDNTLNVLLPIADHAKRFADQLCHNKVVAEHYTHVNVNWRNRSDLSAEDILKETYQVLWARSENLKGMVLHLPDIYEMLLPSQFLQSFWLSHVQTSQLTPDFLSDKVIGLISDQKSYSSYLIPIDSLKKQGINIAALQVNYYDSYKALYDAFNRHEIDIIPSGNWLSSMIDSEVSFKVPIQHRIDTGELYISTSIDNAKLGCAIISAFNIYSPLFNDNGVNYLLTTNCLE